MGRRGLRPCSPLGPWALLHTCNTEKAGKTCLRNLRGGPALRNARRQLSVRSRTGVHGRSQALGADACAGCQHRRGRSRRPIARCPVRPRTSPLLSVNFYSNLIPTAGHPLLPAIAILRPPPGIPLGQRVPKPENVAALPQRFRKCRLHLPCQRLLRRPLCLLQGSPAPWARASNVRENSASPSTPG